MSREFDVRKHTEGIIEFIRNYFRENNLRGIVLGISGGKDSGVVAGLCSLALGPENVIGITMPSSRTWTSSRSGSSSANITSSAASSCSRDETVTQRIP